MSRLFKSSLFPILSAFALIFLTVGLALASGEGGHGEEGSGWKGLAQKTFNFVVLVGFLYWALAPKIKSFFVDRRKDIKELLENTSAQKSEAEKKYREYSEKIDKASLEIDSIFEMIKEQGIAEKQKIIEDAQKVAQKMKEDAKARIEQELQSASSQLRIEAVQLSVKMAEQILKRNITEKDHESMIKEYLDKVVSKN